MSAIDKKIMEIDKVICKNIDRFDATERGLLSQNILSQLRNFVEHVSLKAYSKGHDMEIDYDNIENGNAYVKSNGKLKFLSKFHKLLQITTSHYTLNEENSERLMLKYYEYLLKIKNFLKSNYSLDVLNNIYEFPMTTDSNLKEYYGKISEKINEPIHTSTRNRPNDRYYIQRIKPFFVDYKVYYEVTFTIANDRASKFDRIIAFTKLDISHNYAVKLSLKNETVNILGKKMPILIIDGWEVSIRPCEIRNFAKIFEQDSKISSGNNEYKELMSYLTRTGLNLVEIIDFAEKDYLRIKNLVTEKVKVSHVFVMLDKSQELTNSNSPGSNVIRYLLYRLNNKVIKRQFSAGCCTILSNLKLEYGCIPFDQMPFNTSLLNHNPKLSDLLDCIGTTNREHEIFARFIKNNTETKGQLYTPKKDIKGFENLEELMRRYNNNLYHKHKHQKRRLENYKDYIHIKGYVEDTLSIIQKLKELASSGIDNYSNSVQYWLQSTAYDIDSHEKKIAFERMFEKSKVAFIYGSAGTGKSTMINHISNFFNDEKKLYLANTNPAVDNLKRRVSAANCTYKTIAKFIKQRNSDMEFDLLVIDECSTVSNVDMLEVLNKASFRLIVLVGDTFQIDSIVFGNWFDAARSFVPGTSVYELTKPYRSTNQKLITLWEKVRNMDEDILEHVARNDYSITLDESIFEHSGEDEIILCLNYDGLYGINNINRFLQSNNKNRPVQWGIQTYKVNDPVLFNESERFAPIIYNNLKGKIVKIETFEDRIQFDIEIDKVINEFQAEGYDFHLIGNSDNGNSVIRFFVDEYNNTDEDDDSPTEAVVPSQVAYAVSIHKAQGLEYNSVKIVITDEIEEMITHNIFYTAITRAKEQLRIYWTPETEYKVLSNLESKNIRRDIALLKSSQQVIQI
ncbi:ATP-dependent DNA helicase [Gracilibacillus massiliensis]|uniref:ATP-dependent DNA helicase n=1 Tax=Gracilibacillus massiliensis TaxID=1564956 RepID=UPI00071DC2D2|nr:AAA family ATPase [Gracilibacillus massiliensis]